MILRLILFLLASVVVADAQGVLLGRQRQERKAGAAVASCATTDTTLGRDQFLEGFQTVTTGVNDGNSWTYTEVGTTANIDTYHDTTALTTGKPTGACDRGMRIVAPSDGTETYGQWNKGSEIDVDAGGLVVVFHIYVETALDDTESVYVGGAVNGAGNTCFFVNMRNSGGNTQLQTSASTVASWTTVSTGTWVEVKVTLDAAAAAGGCSVTYNGASGGTFTRIAARDLQTLKLGCVSGLESGDTPTFAWDLVAIDVP